MKLKTRQGTIEKYLNFLQSLSKKNGVYTNVNAIGKEYQIGRQVVQALKERNVIYLKLDGTYYWNNTFTPNVDLVNVILKDISRINHKHQQMRKIKESHRQVQIKVKNEPLVKRKRKPKEPVEKIGLIRKFIKFIW